MKREKIVGIIPARFNSKRFPGKVLYTIKGKTLLQHTYERSCLAKSLSEIYIATDSKKIANTAESFGAKVVMTSSNCRSGSDRAAEAAQQIDASIIVNVQADEPFLPTEAIEEPLKILLKNKDIYIATSVTRIKEKEELYDQNVVKTVLDRENFALYFSRSLIPFPRIYFDDDKLTYLKKVMFYKHIGAYIFRKSLLDKFAQWQTSFLENIESLEQLRILENGYKIKVSIIKKDSPCVDTLEDIKKLQ